jgi:PAS domain-containing protein
MTDETAGLRSTSASHDLWIDTDRSGLILDCSLAALSLLAYSFKGAIGRDLSLMFLADRPSGQQLAHALLGHPVEREGVIRPRERRGVSVRYRIELQPDDNGGQAVLRWTFDRL